MAKGDTYTAGPTSVVAGGVLDLQPGAGTEITIHNIMHEETIELQWYNGTDVMTFLEDTGKGILENLRIRCTNAVRLRVKNTAASAKFIGASGMYTK
jgi:hypothetical protein